VSKLKRNFRMVTNKKNIKPSFSDINNLREVQLYTNQITKINKDKRQTEIFFYASIFLFILGFFFWSSPEAFSFISGLGLFGIIFVGIGMHSHLKGGQYYRSKYLYEERQKKLDEVECKYSEKDDKYYVYLEDGRRIEVDEY